MLGELIAAGAKLAGGLLGQSAQKSAVKRAENWENTAVQRRVADAKAAGVHPLYALGAPLQSSVAQSVGSPLGESISSMGQNIERAAEAYAPAETKVQNHLNKYNELTLQNMELQNAILASRLATVNQAGQPPGVGVSRFGESETPGHIGRPAEMVEPSYRFAGFDMRSSPFFSNAQTFEDRFGEGADWMMLPLSVPADIAHTNYPGPGKALNYYRNYRKWLKGY